MSEQEKTIYRKGGSGMVLMLVCINKYQGFFRDFLRPSRHDHHQHSQTSPSNMRSRLYSKMLNMRLPMASPLSDKLYTQRTSRQNQTESSIVSTTHLL